MWLGITAFGEVSVPRRSAPRYAGSSTSPASTSRASTVPGGNGWCASNRSTENDRALGVLLNRDANRAHAHFGFSDGLFRHIRALIRRQNRLGRGGEGRRVGGERRRRGTPAKRGLRLPRRARQIGRRVRESEDALVVALFFGFVGGAPNPTRRFRNIAARFERLSRFEGQEHLIRIGTRGPRCAQCRRERSRTELRHDGYVSSRLRLEQELIMGS